MARPLLEGDLWAAMELLLPPEPPRPKGGRKRIASRQVLTGILFVLRTGIPWELLPKEMGSRQWMRRRHSKARIARRMVDSSESLGRHRWVVERTLAWLNRFRRLTIRYERRADIHEAFLNLGCIPHLSVEKKYERVHLLLRLVKLRYPVSLPANDAGVGVAVGVIERIADDLAIIPRVENEDVCLAATSRRKGVVSGSEDAIFVGCLQHWFGDVFQDLGSSRSASLWARKRPRQ